jgi:4-hydroxy-2-oxoheptanedioate aldolase
MMNAPNKILERMRDGAVAKGVVCRTLSPVVVELIGLAGFDFVWIDMEHTGADFGVVEQLCRAADGAGVTTLVRVPDKSPASVLRALEIGAAIVNVPGVEARAEAEAVARAARYFPRGERGFCPSSRGNAYGLGRSAADVFATANERVMAMVQVESRRGVENAAEICAVPGLDIVFVGRGDLSQSLGAGGIDEPAVVESTHRVLEAAREFEKIAAIQVHSADDAKRWLAAGVRVLCCAVDVVAIGQMLVRVREGFDGPVLKGQA